MPYKQQSRFGTLLVILLTAGLLSAADKKDKPPSDLPDTTESAALVEKMPKSVAGTVYLDRNGNGRGDKDEGLAGVPVTDGVDFVATDTNGTYTIEIKPDPSRIQLILPQGSG